MAAAQVPVGIPEQYHRRFGAGGAAAGDFITPCSHHGFIRHVQSR
ncbi:hypothetical protein ASZ90_014959 [hydrocarbon metagenome]|uniref:Uncharacterized protein n=1 Tax=hydrocarbon metagenome TaxID=938273 RepID=A0A0W8F392_9ZZZZ